MAMCRGRSSSEAQRPHCLALSALARRRRQEYAHREYAHKLEVAYSLLDANWKTQAVMGTISQDEGVPLVPG